MQKHHRDFLSDRVFQAEMSRCESCRSGPCHEACPAGCSPTDFIRAASGGTSSDIRRAAALLRRQNPMAGVCGAVCAEKHCVAACSRQMTGTPLPIPAIQKAIIERSTPEGALVFFEGAAANGKSVAVVGAGPAGLSAAAYLAQSGCTVEVFEKAPHCGGMCRLIPESRLPAALLEADIAFVQGLGVHLTTNTPVADVNALLAQYDGVIDATGRWESNRLPVSGAALAMDALSYLRAPVSAERVVTIGCGGIAVDCVRTALERGAAQVEILALESLGELSLGAEELAVLFRQGVLLHPRHGAVSIEKTERGLVVTAQRLELPRGCTFSPEQMQRIDGSAYALEPADLVIMAVGTHGAAYPQSERIVAAGECAIGAATVVQSVASGKAAAIALLARLGLGSELPEPGKAPLPGFRERPVSLACTVLGYPSRSPFILSASPMTDGYAQVRAAYEAGWSGAILKTAFDGIPVKTPAAYMHCADAFSYANCDSVSARTLTQLCEDVARLRAEYPDRLTMASTGTEMTGDDAEDRRRWQSITEKLEAADAMAIEYSLSCPGTDGADALALNQDIDKSCRVIRWILQAGRPEIPKLFKLSASVPALGRFVERIRQVCGDFPTAVVAITVGDTLPNLIFQKRGDGVWEDGVIMGMGGRRIFCINAFSIANCVGRGLPIAASGGVMSYRDAANALALGAEFVQFCSLPMRYGYGIINELESGLSALLLERGFSSVSKLHRASRVFPFEKLSETKQIPAVDRSRCARCGNCTSCHAQAVCLDADGYPTFDPERCLGCTFCTQICFTGALHMKDR